MERSCFENAVDGFSSLKYDCKLKINKKNFNLANISYGPVFIDG